MDLTFIIDIFKLAGIYVAMGLGFVIIYRASRVLNLSQPGLIMLGAFVALRYLPDPDGGSPAVLSLLVRLYSDRGAGSAGGYGRVPGSGAANGGKSPRFDRAHDARNTLHVRGRDRRLLDG
jgi:ABC-type uncharacterized transport system permease subunit